MTALANLVSPIRFLAEIAKHYRLCSVRAAKAPLDVKRGPVLVIVHRTSPNPKAKTAASISFSIFFSCVILHDWGYVGYVS